MGRWRLGFWRSSIRFSFFGVHIRLEYAHVCIARLPTFSYDMTRSIRRCFALGNLERLPDFRPDFCAHPAIACRQVTIESHFRSFLCVRFYFQERPLPPERYAETATQTTKGFPEGNRRNPGDSRYLENVQNFTGIRNQLNVNTAIPVLKRRFDFDNS
jgi:hypothetical protein